MAGTYGLEKMSDLKISRNDQISDAFFSSHCKKTRHLCQNIVAHKKGRNGFYGEGEGKTSQQSA